MEAGLGIGSRGVQWSLARETPLYMTFKMSASVCCRCKYRLLLGFEKYIQLVQSPGLNVWISSCDVWSWLEAWG